MKGLDAVDSGTMSTNVLSVPDVEPPDQGLCAGNGYVVESDNIGEILVLDKAATAPRWGDYSAALFVPGSGGKVYFANEYIPYPSCEPPAFTLTLATCGGTRDDLANWGTSVNSVVP